MVAASTLLELIWKNTISPYCYILVVFFVIDGFINMVSSLLEKGENPHAIVMSATPIPRTLNIWPH